MPCAWLMARVNESTEYTSIVVSPASVPAGTVSGSIVRDGRAAYAATAVTPATTSVARSMNLFLLARKPLMELLSSCVMNLPARR